MDFFESARSIIVIIHAFVAAIAIGATTVTDLLFFRFLKDLKISEYEEGIFKLMSRVMWTMLVLLVLSGLALYLADPVRLATSSKFLVKVVVVGVIFLNGIVLHAIASRHMRRDMDFHDGQAAHAHPVRKRISFAAGAISLSSWYSTFLLGSLAGIPLTFGQGVAVYAAILCIAIGGSQLAFVRFVREGEERVDSEE